MTLADGQVLRADLVVGAGGATPHGWPAPTALPLDNGFIRVRDTLQVVGHDEVFAAGDCAHLTHAPRPKAGVYAVRAARVLVANLRASVTGGRMRRYHPQRHFLRLVSLGDRRAAAEKWPGLPLVPAGTAVWRWKDRIDRRFMRRFTDLPRMKVAVPGDAAEGVAEILGQAPLCAGCGSKVGSGVLSEVLGRLPQVPRDDVLTGPGDDAGVLAIGGQTQVLTTDHLRAFTEDPDLMARIAAQHALGDVRAMGARAQSALAQIILPRASDPLQARMMEEIMTAAGEVFAAEGAVILGGHSTMGAELTIGFTVTGLCDGDPVTVGGAQEGEGGGRRRAVVGDGRRAGGSGGGAAQGTRDDGCDGLWTGRTPDGNVPGVRAGGEDRPGVGAGLSRCARNVGKRRAFNPLRVEPRGGAGVRPAGCAGGAAARSADGGRSAGGRGAGTGRRAVGRSARARRDGGGDRTDDGGAGRPCASTICAAVRARVASDRSGRV